MCRERLAPGCAGRGQEKRDAKRQDHRNKVNTMINLIDRPAVAKSINRSKALTDESGSLPFACDLVPRVMRP